MRDIALDLKPSQLPVNTFVVYGNTRTGKTEWAATFPRVCAIADVTEGGFSTIQNMDRSLFFEEDYPPIIKGVENMGDIAALTPWLKQEIARKRIMTVVFDAFTFYTDFYLAKLIALQTAGGKAIDNRQAYGSLGVHLREVRSNLHSLGVNVVWNCLAKHPDTDDPTGKPLIPGQQADKFAAGVDFLFHSRIEQTKENGVVTDNFEIRTRQFGKYIAGNRLGAKAAQLPDPFQGTYAQFLQYLGYDVDAVRAAMPKVLAAAPAAAGPAAVVNKGPVAKGPVVITRSPSKAITPPAENNQAPRGAAVNK